MTSKRKNQVTLLSSGAILSIIVALSLNRLTTVGEVASTSATAVRDLFIGLDLLLVFSIMGGVVCVSFLLSFLAEALTDAQKFNSVDETINC